MSGPELSALETYIATWIARHDFERGKSNSEVVQEAAEHRRRAVSLGQLHPPLARFGFDSLQAFSQELGACPDLWTAPRTLEITYLRESRASVLCCWHVLQRSRFLKCAPRQHSLKKARDALDHRFAFSALRRHHRLVLDQRTPGKKGSAARCRGLNACVSTRVEVPAIGVALPLTPQRRIKTTALSGQEQPCQPRRHSAKAESGARDEFLMAAVAQNLRRMARWLTPATV